MLKRRDDDVHYSEPVTTGTQESWVAGHWVSGVQPISVPAHAMMESPDPQGQPGMAAVWIGRREALLDGEPAVTACERFVDLIARLAEACAT